MMTRPRSTPSCAKIACWASPERPAAQVWVEMGTPVAFWARAEARRMASSTGVTPAVSVAHLMMAALTPMGPVPGGAGRARDGVLVHGGGAELGRGDRAGRRLDRGHLLDAGATGRRVREAS